MLAILVLLSGCASSPLAPRAIRMNDEGAVALAARDLDAAEARFRLALEYHPGFAEPWSNLGLVFLARGELEEAERCFRGAIALDEDFAEAWNGVGLVRMSEGAIEGAMPAFRAALAIDPGYLEARRNLAECHLALGEHAAARAQLLRYVVLAPRDPVGLSLLAGAELALGRPFEARRRAEDALRVDPDRPFARLVRGEARLEDGELDAAREDLYVARRDPSLRSHVEGPLAEIDLRTGHEEIAWRAAQRILATRPDDPHARHVAAVIALRQGQPDVALVHARAAIAAGHGDRDVLEVACALSGSC